MLIYSVIPPEVVLDEPERRPRGPLADLPLPRGQGRVLVRRDGPGRGVVERVCSTDPRHYLDPCLAPGAPCRLPD